MKPTREGGFDLHGHTASTSTDKKEFWRRVDIVNMSPEQMVIDAKNAGLDGVAITDHDTVRGLDRALNAAAKEGVIVVPGVEITAHDKNLNFPHILCLGLDPDLMKGEDNKIPRFKNPETVIKWIHDHGAIAVATHPSQFGGKLRSNMTYDRVDELSDKDKTHFSKLFDAIQTHNIQHGKNEIASEIADKHGIPKIGGSDFHLHGQVGIVRTKIFQQVENWQGLIQAIREGKTEPFFQQNITEDMLGNFGKHGRGRIILQNLSSLLV